MKKFGIVIVVLAVCFAMIGLSASADVETQKISLNGSTSMEKMVNAIKDGVVYDYPELSLEPQFTGSSAGIEAVINGKSNIGNSSRELKESELEQGLVSNVVAIDAIAIVTDIDNKTDNLTKEQLIDIYTGKIRNWKEVGGDDLPIVVIGREAGSGTRSAFEEILGNNKPAFVERYKLSSEEGINLIKSAGGIPVLAHPCIIQSFSLSKVIADMIKYGVEGIEVFHTLHSKLDEGDLLNYVIKNNLLITGGSDCHEKLDSNGEFVIGSKGISLEHIQKLKGR